VEQSRFRQQDELRPSAVECVRPHTRQALRDDFVQARVIRVEPQIEFGLVTIVEALNLQPPARVIIARPNDDVASIDLAGGRIVMYATPLRQIMRTKMQKKTHFMG